MVNQAAIATSILLFEYIVWVIRFLTDKEICTNYICSKVWKWICATFAAINVGRSAYLMVAGTSQAEGFELLLFVMWSITWIVYFGKYYFSDGRLWLANKKMLQRLSCRCSCGGKIVCRQAVKFLKSVDENGDEERCICVFYQIRCKRCKKETGWYDDLDAACAAWAETEENNLNQTQKEDTK